ncbi:MAG: hypothetical protein ACJ75Q_00570 [Gaiellaceae bacterium]
MSAAPDRGPEAPRVKVLLEEALRLLGCEVGPHSVQLRAHDGHLVKVYVTAELGASSLHRFDPEPESAE